MNVNLQGARRQTRLEWDVLEARNQKARLLPKRIFLAVMIAFAAYVGWAYLST
jgi:hypothetical protein